MLPLESNPNAPTSRINFLGAPLLPYIACMALGYALAERFNLRTCQIELAFLGTLLTVLALSLYFAIPGNRKPFFIVLGYAGFTMISMAYFYFRIPADPFPHGAPFEAEFTAKIDEVSASHKGSIYGCATIDAPPRGHEKLCGVRIWYCISPDKKGIIAAPKFERSAILKFKGILHPVEDSWLPSRGRTFTDQESELADKRLNEYIASRQIPYKIDAYPENVRILKPAVFPYTLYASLRDGIKNSLGKFAFDFQYNTNAAAAYPAMVLGDKSSLTKEMRAAFANTGTMHIFAVSGLHVGFVAAMTFAFLSFLRLDWRLQGIMAIPLIFLYAEICGGRPSAMRAFGMVAAVWAGLMIGRGSGAFLALLLTAAAALLFQPDCIFDAGFTLSYFIVAAIVVEGGEFFDWLKSKKFTKRIGNEKKSYARRIFSSTFDRAFNFTAGGTAISAAAFFAAAPLTAHYFGNISPISIIISPLYVLCASFAVGLGILSSLLPEFIGEWINSAAWFDVAAMTESAGWLDKNFYLTIPAEIKSGFAAAFITIIFLALSALRISTPLRFAIPPLAAAIMFIGATTWGL